MPEQTKIPLIVHCIDDIISAINRTGDAKLEDLIKRLFVLFDEYHCNESNIATLAQPYHLHALINQWMDEPVRDEQKLTEILDFIISLKKDLQATAQHSPPESSEHALARLLALIDDLIAGFTGTYDYELMEENISKFSLVFRDWWTVSNQTNKVYDRAVEIAAVMSDMHQELDLETDHHQSVAKQLSTFKERVTNSSPPRKQAKKAKLK